MSANRAQRYLFKVINPKDPTGPKIDAIITSDIYSRCYKYNPIRYENLRAAKYVLENTERIFGSIRKFNEGGWCYTGKPYEWCIKEGVIVPFPNNKIYAVYLNPNMYVYEWRAEHAADDDPMAPVGWENRYGAIIWKNTS